MRRPGLPQYLRVRYCMALHEAGRALVATVLRRRRLAAGLAPRLERVERVSIIARGRWDIHSRKCPSSPGASFLTSLCTCLGGSIYLLALHGLLHVSF